MGHFSFTQGHLVLRGKASKKQAVILFNLKGGVYWVLKNPGLLSAFKLASSFFKAFSLLIPAPRHVSLFKFYQGCINRVLLPKKFVNNNDLGQRGLKTPS